MYGTADISTDYDSSMYELEGKREFCHFLSLSVEITSCSFLFIRRISLCLVGKAVIDP